MISKKISYKTMKKYYLEDFLSEQLKDPKFRMEWEKSEAEYQAGRELIKARIEARRLVFR